MVQRLPSDAQPAQRLSPPLVVLLLVLAAVLPSANGLGAFFVGDDFDFLARMQRMDGAADAVHMTYWGEWEPLWYLGFYRDWVLWGLQPAGYRAASLFWLALGVVALYFLVRDAWPEAGLAPWAAALLFATHPLHDEAVTYLAARGHPMSTALAIVALWAYVRMRRQASRSRRFAWAAAALSAAFGAALAKEIALVLPAWIVVLEWGVFGRFRFDRTAWWRALRAGLLFLAPVASYVALRWAVVGLGSHKLSGPDDGLQAVLESCVRFLPEYALIGGLPLPFAFVEHDIVRVLRPLGWVVVASLVVGTIVGAVRGPRLRGEVSLSVGFFAFALVIVVLALLPVFWAELAVKRRYFFMPSVGAALAAAVVFQWCAARRARAARWLLVVLALAGALGLVHRNDLYRQAGRITLDLFETAREAPLNRPSPRHRGVQRRVALVTLPRYLGGDDLSGAYVLHDTDVRSLFRLAGERLIDYSNGLKCHYADDYSAEVVFESQDVLALSLRFRTRRAFAAASRRVPEEDREGRQIRVVRASSDEETRVLEYKVLLAPGFLRDPRSELYLYGNGRFRRLDLPR